jgi:hypothetical protein
MLGLVKCLTRIPLFVNPTVVIKPNIITAHFGKRKSYSVGLGLRNKETTQRIRAPKLRAW